MFKIFKINFKKKFKKYKEKPKSKRKFFIIGFTTAVGIFGLTLFGPALSTVAKNILKGNPKPTDSAPSPSVSPTNGLSGLAASVCYLAITSVVFAVGVSCGFIVGIGVLHI